MSNDILARAGMVQKVAQAKNDPQERMKLAEASTDFTRITIREEGLLRRWHPPTPLTVAECDTQLDTDRPVKIVEKEVLQPLSMSVPFGTLPRNFYMVGDKYRVDFARLVTRNYVADVMTLETHNKDLKTFYKENAILDMTLAEDIPWFDSVDSIVTPASPPTSGNWATNSATGGAMASPLTGKVQYYDFTHVSRNPLATSAGFTRETFVESFKILSTSFTPGGPGDDCVPIRHTTERCLMNVNTALELVKLDHDAFGGPGAEDMLKSGMTETTWMGKKFIFTIKDDIVKDGEMYMSAAPEFVGKFYELEEPTMFVDVRAFMIEFFIYSCVGMSIGNPFSQAKVKFF
jgi:hypothetical protein